MLFFEISYLHKEVQSINTKLNNNIKKIMRYCTDEVGSCSYEISREMNWPYIEVMVRYKSKNKKIHENIHQKLKNYSFKDLC
jgi:hypothetical protein